MVDLQLEDLALHVDGDLLRQVAERDGGRHLGDVADLAGQVLGHQVDVVGEVLPGAADALDAGLAAELAFGADLARHARHFRGERVELIDHRVDGVLQLENLALHVDGDLLRQVARRHGGGHFGDVADLPGQVGRHGVDVVGQVLPGAGDALDAGLAAELALGADLARHARHFRGERGKLADHRVDDLADAQEFAAQRAAVDLDHHGLRQVALGDGADDARHFGGRLHHVLDEVVDRAHAGFPAAGGVAHMAALADAAVLADDPAQPLELAGQLVVEVDDLVEGFGDLGIEAVIIVGDAHRKIAAPEGAQRRQDLTAVKLVLGLLARRLDIHGIPLRILGSVIGCLKWVESW